MFKLPDFFELMDHHEQQMLLVHAAMSEDVGRVCVENMSEHFRNVEKRNADYFREGLAWSVQAMVSEAAELLEMALFREHQDKLTPLPGDDSKVAFMKAYGMGSSTAHVESARRIVRKGYQALRSHRMKPSVRSKHWDRVEPRFLELFDNTGDPRDPGYRD